MKQSITVIILALILGGCAATNQGQATHYSQAQANQQLQSEIVSILLISAITLEIDNKKNQELATKGVGIAGALLGAYLGSTTDSSSSYGFSNTAIGALAGGAVGAVGGSAVGGTKTVAGVSVTYSIGDETYTAIQQGELCQFQEGKALAVSTETETRRIQPNTTCPVIEET